MTAIAVTWSFLSESGQRVRGGTNPKRIAARDYAVQTLGTWMDEGP